MLMGLGEPGRHQVGISGFKYPEMVNVAAFNCASRDFGIISMLKLFPASPALNDTIAGTR